MFFWRHGVEECGAGAEGLIAWQVAARRAAAGKDAHVQATANEASVERAAAENADEAPEVEAVASPASTENAVAEQTAAAKLAVGSKPRVPSILTLLTARVSSEIDPVRIEVAENVAL